MSVQSHICGLCRSSAVDQRNGYQLLTFVENGQDGFEVGMHLHRRGLAQREVALPNIACAGPCNERAGQRLPLHMLIIGPAVNVDDIAHTMFHGLHLGCGDQPTLVTGVRIRVAQREAGELRAGERRGH